jgi:hypothetical protein
MEAAFINGLLLALTHAVGRRYDLTAAETPVSGGVSGLPAATKVSGKS